MRLPRIFRKRDYKKVVQLPDSVQEGTQQAAIYRDVAGGITDVQELKRLHPDFSVNSVLAALKIKSVLENDGRGKVRLPVHQNAPLPNISATKPVVAKSGIATLHQPPKPPGLPAGSAGKVPKLPAPAPVNVVPRTEKATTAPQRTAPVIDGYEHSVLTERAGYEKDGALIPVNKGMILKRYSGSDGTDFDKWWNSTRESGSPEGGAVRYMERALEGLSGDERRFVLFYLAQILRNPGRDSVSYKVSDFRRAAIASDAAQKMRRNGAMPDEFYAALQVLDPLDDRTSYILGEVLLRERAEPGKGLELLRDAAMQKDPESAYGAIKEKYRIFMG